MEKKYKAIIIGGGAAGLVVAAAAKTLDILIIEANPRVGKKLLATGNGKCNLMNLRLSPEYYNDASFVTPVFERCGVDKMIEFFARLGLIMRFDDEDRGYPLSESAATVLDVLRRAVVNRGVTVLCDNKATKIQKEEGVFCVTTDKGGKYFADKVVFATGSPAGFGLDSLCLLNNVDYRPFSPSLAPLITETDVIAGLNGVRVKCRASLVSCGKVIAVENGEVLFKSFGLSGIAVFNLSAAYVRAGCPSDAYISLDLLDGVKDLFAVRAQGRKAADFMTGVFQKMLNLAVLKYAGVGEDERVIDCVAEKLYNAACDFEIKIKSTADVSLAQVSSGGITTAAVNKNTLAYEGDENLYFCGEALDVDGLSGGYNLMWAWASAFTVAENL